MPSTTRQKPRAATFTLMSPPACVQSALFTATTPQPEPKYDWNEKQAQRLDRFTQRVQKILRRWKIKGKLTSRYPLVVKRCFGKNDSDVACAQDLVDAEKAAVKAAKKWWKPRPKTCDDRIARKFANCKSMPMFKE